MKHLILLISIFLAFANETPNLTTIEDQKVESKDSILLELELLQEQLDLTERKILLLRQLRTHYLNNNLTIPEIDSNILTQTLQQMNSNRFSSNYIGKPSQTQFFSGNNDQSREKSDVSFMNKVFKKYTLNFDHSVVDMQYLPTKSYQRTQEDPASNYIMSFLTTQNELILMDMNGNTLYKLVPEYSIIKMTVSPFTDEYFIATIDSNNILRMYQLELQKTRLDTPVNAQNDTKAKKEKPKYIQTYILALEYTYDLSINHIVSNDTVGEQKDHTIPLFFGSIMARSNKYLVLTRLDGSITFINKNGTLRGTYQSGDSPIHGVHKFYPNPLFTSSKSIGFFNPNLMQVANPPCDLPGDSVLTLEVDQYSTTNFFVLTDVGEILFYELKQSVPSCKSNNPNIFVKFLVIAKRIAFDPAIENDFYHIYNAKGFVFIQQGEKGIHLLSHNISDVMFGDTDQREVFNISLYPFRDSQINVVKGRYFTQRNSFQSTYIGAYFQFDNGTSTFTLYDLAIPVRPTNDWFSNMRFPIIIIAIILVMGYQIWSRKQKKDKDEFDKLDKYSRYKLDEMAHGKQGKGRDLSSLKEELDSLSKHTRTLEDSLGNLPLGGKSKSRSKKAYYEDDEGDENLQDIISTKKNQ